MTFSEYLKKAFRWESGRQHSGYDKMLLLTGRYPIPFDMYLLRFPKGSYIAEHVDTVESGKHFRLNVILKKAELGGEFNCEKMIWESARIKLFRPDIMKHSVGRIEKGERYVLSVGWVKGPSPRVWGTCSVLH